jgi:hypothetical protein
VLLSIGGRGERSCGVGERGWGKRVGKEGGERVGGTRKVLRICYR